MHTFAHLITVGMHGAQRLRRLGGGVIQFALDHIYGPPQAFHHVVQLPASPFAAQARSSKSALKRGPQPGSSKPGPTEAMAVTPPTPVRPVSEQVRTAQLVGPHGVVYGVMWLYLYPATRRARRVLKIRDQHLARALKRNRFEFCEVPFDPVAGCKPLFDAFHLECKRVLNPRPPIGRQESRGGEGAALAGQAIDGQIHAKSEVGAEASRPAGASARPPAAPAPAPVAATAVAAGGDEYRGVVTSAARTARTGPDGSQYTTFCLTLNDGLREVPLFGTELERQAADLAIRPGERVRVVFMGRAAAQIPGQTRTSYRNLYQLTRMDPS